MVNSIKFLGITVEPVLAKWTVNTEIFQYQSNWKLSLHPPDQD